MHIFIRSSIQSHRMNIQPMKYNATSASESKNGSPSTPSQWRAHWSPEQHKLFIQLCIEQVQKGNRPTTHLNKKGWKELCDEFSKRTGRFYDKKKMKNHWDTTKGTWKVWHKLVSTPDAGWDPVTRTITAGDDFWDSYLQDNPSAAQFRYNELPHAVELDYMYAEALVNGDFKLANSDIMHQSPVRPLHMNAQVADTPGEEVETQHPFTDELDFGDNEEIGLDSRSFPQGVKRKRISDTEKIGRTLDRLCEAIESRRSTCTPQPDRPDKGFTIKDCIELLNETPDLPIGSDLYMFALDLFLKSDFREMFVSLPVEVRVAWLQRKQQC